MNNAAVFIDGFNLYHGICDAGWRPWLWVDLFELGRQLKPGTANLQVVKYYSANAKEAGSRERQGDFLEANRELHPPSELKMIMGFMADEDCCRCSRCGTVSRRWFEKRTDVAMAVDLVHEALREPRSIDLAIIVTGDADQAPAIELAREAGLRIEVRMPPERPSGHLTKAAGGDLHARHVTLPQLKKSQLPDLLNRVGGKLPIRRPQEWGNRTT
jgi:uncharacterized LabA/DUF88 family protein